jgi:sugar/nucleoside kinase (ribokinase family)
LTQRTLDCIVIGEINPDLILNGNIEPVFGQVEKLVDGLDLTIGSSACIFACGLARLGMKVGIIGRAGRDAFGDFMLNALCAKGIDTSGVVRSTTGTALSVILARPGGDRAILTYAGAIPEFCYTDIDQAVLQKARHMHLASYFLHTALKPDVPRLFDLAHALGLTTSMDTNYDPAETWGGGLNGLLEKVDVFMPNTTECRGIAGTSDVNEAVERLARRVGILAVKLGADGAMLCSAGHTMRTPGLKMDVVDTVGAGDSFDAGFLYGYLSGWPLERSLRMGAVCGSLSTRKAGGTNAQAEVAEALPFL